MELLAPPDGADLKGEVVFRWVPTATLPEGYGFEVFRWGQGATRELGQAMEQPTTGTSQRIDLEVLDLAPNRPYSWGVRLVRLGASNLAEAEAQPLSKDRSFTYKP